MGLLFVIEGSYIRVNTPAYPWLAIAQKTKPPPYLMRVLYGSFKLLNNS